MNIRTKIAAGAVALAMVGGVAAGCGGGSETVIRHVSENCENAILNFSSGDDPTPTEIILNLGGLVLACETPEEFAASNNRIGGPELVRKGKEMFRNGCELDRVTGLDILPSHWCPVEGEVT